MTGVLGAAGGFAFAVAFGGLGVDGVEGPAALQELIHGGAAGGFQRQGAAGVGLHFMGELRPTLSGVGETELGDDRAGAVHDDDVVVVAGPVEGGEVRMLIPVGIHGACGPQRRRPAGRARPDTRALVGRCSLSAWPGGHPRSRQSLPDPRGVWDGQPCLRGGRCLTADSMAGGKVIHQLGRSAGTGALPALVNNFGRRIREGVRGSLALHIGF